MLAPVDEATERRERTPAGPSLATVVGAAFGLWGLLIGLKPLRDNSFLTHLATGRLILDGGIPRTDPYSFTAGGEPWVVQSWLASLCYGISEKLAGINGVRLLTAGLTLALALLVWALCRPADGLAGRVGAAALALGVATGMWVERPLLFGLVFLGALLVALEGRLDPRWMVPVMWLWVNTHGSFPLGIAAALAFAAGRRLDGERPVVELAVLRWSALGVVLAGINPLGPKLLAFPLELLRKTDSFRVIIEWNAPTFTSAAQRVFLVQLLVAVALVVRRPRWRTVVPLLLFSAAALTSLRNVPVASLVLLPGMALALRGVGSVRGDQRTPATRLGLAAVVVAGAVLGAAALGGKDTDLAAYPTDAVAWLEDREMVADPDVRLVTRDFVGNYLEAKHGAAANVFFDDRVDMYPTEVVEDYVVLMRAKPGWDGVLDRHGADAVLWDRESPLAQLLEASPDWDVTYRDDQWIVAQPA